MTLKILFLFQLFRIVNSPKQTKVKKIKFKVLTKKNILTNHDLINKLNNAMDGPESEMLSSKYYEPNEIAALFKNINKHFSFFHLNISSLPFHFEELSTLITEHNLNFFSLNIQVSLKTKPKSIDLNPAIRI